MNYELFCRKTKQKNKNPDPFLLVGFKFLNGETIYTFRHSIL